MLPNFTAQEFVAKWRRVDLSERSMVQQHFMDVCRLDEAVFAAYGWPADLSDDEILARLLALNLERAGRQGKAENIEEEDADED